MGKKGIEIVRLDVQDIIGTLNKAYADEWLAVYNFRLASHLASGLNSPTVSDILRKSSLEEMGHADKIAERILQLGGEPIRSIGQLEAHANSPSFNMPEDHTDLNGILRAALEAERSAIQVYQSLLTKTKDKDTVTYELIEELLVDEVADEEAFETLLGE